MTILVTGATGRVGRGVVALLLEAGAPVVELSERGQLAALQTGKPIGPDHATV